MVGNLPICSNLLLQMNFQKQQALENGQSCIYSSWFTYSSVLEYALSAWKFYPGKGKFFMEEQSIELEENKIRCYYDLLLKFIYYCSIFLQVDCFDLTKARVKHHIKIILMEILLWSPYPGAILLVTCHLKS